MRECRGRQSPLRCGGGPHRFRNDRKDNEERVPLDADLEPAIFECPAEQTGMHLEDVLVAVGAQLGLELRRALDVGEKECQGASRQPPPRTHPSLILRHRAFAKTQASL